MAGANGMGDLRGQGIAHDDDGVGALDVDDEHRLAGLDRVVGRDGAALDQAVLDGDVHLPGAAARAGDRKIDGSGGPDRALELERAVALELQHRAHHRRRRDRRREAADERGHEREPAEPEAQRGEPREPEEGDAGRERAHAEQVEPRGVLTVQVVRRVVVVADADEPQHELEREHGAAEEGAGEEERGHADGDGVVPQD